ncbi:ribosome maturation factor RimM [Clavibacter michiganensis]|uniref:ribosome maturation factor RimM n=1 Tax=Clavibacter michiganensis TaxID=28447 RepID=UPI000A3BB0B0|nr:ribosome maturation factor RimM [Clavibacter michiganensis]MDO4030581.1 ribosome maturation factor RimM [Clavibacter michiganensis]MDO4081557.1 ribosome maturation factor RimM [Clavibacter michiganensis]MDO4086113.1 ribosome maturation factor RimM [Clavibacter michiganensis]MDO4095583.1 ribosome maturation factor RimM [Clavibacter michiganensis]MDO4100783.1 ribosome maturation factor RimM [Clavibacter michiganensis]
MWWTPIPEDIVRDPAAFRVGRLTKAHGLKGAVKLELFTDDPDKRFVPGAEFSLQVPESSLWHGRTLTLTELRWYNSHPVGFFDGVADRTAAESLAKAILWMTPPADEAAEPDAWYDHQLVGLTVLRDGVEVGTVSLVDHFPAQDLLHVDTPSGTVLVPFVQAIVPSVDVEAGTLVVTPPLGLFEEIPDETPTAEPTPAEAAEPAPEGDDAR